MGFRVLNETGELPEGSDIKSLVGKVAYYIWKDDGCEDSYRNWNQAQGLVFKTLPNLPQHIFNDDQLNGHLKCLASTMSGDGKDPDTLKCWDMALDYLARDILRDR